MADQGDSTTVHFLSVADRYTPQKDLTVGFKCAANLDVSSSDWVGIFKVGWASTRDYYTFEWVKWSKPAETNTQRAGSVTFAQKRLPPCDGNRYQFCYVGNRYSLKGCSRAFTISGDVEASLVDAEFEEISVDELGQLHSMVVVNTTPGSKDDVLKMQEHVKQVTDEKELLAKEVLHLKEELSAKQKENALVHEQLDCQGQATKQSITELQEEVQKLTNKLFAIEKENELLTASKSEIETQNGKLHSQVDELTRILESMQKDVSTANATKSDLEAAKMVLEKEIQLLKESSVPREAFEALQKAQETPLQPVDGSIAIISENEVLRARNDELVTKLNMCRDEYTQKCLEVRNLQKKAGSKSSDHTVSCDDMIMQELDQRREKCQELEQEKLEVEEKLRNMEQTILQNAAELVAKDDEVNTLQGQVLQLTEELGRVKDDQLKKDQQVKNTIASLRRQIEQLQPTHNMPTAGENISRERGTQLPPAQNMPAAQKPKNKPSEAKECPMCMIKFPASMAAHEFQAHVQSHFEY